MDASLKLKSLYQLTNELEKVMLNRSAKPDLPITTLPELNKKIHGFHKRKLTVIGARTSHAKTSFSLQLAYDVAKQGKEVLFLSLEMDKVDMLERLFCNRKKVDNYALLTGSFGHDYKREWLEFIEEIRTVPLIFSDCIGKNWKEIDDLIKNLTIKPQMIILDYIQAIKGEGFNAKEKVDDYILNFRKMAIQHNFAGVLCSQVNRSNESESNKFPQLHQLKGTGVLEEHADIVILLYYKFKSTEKEEDKNEFWFSVAKNRNGRTGSLKIKFIPEFYLFEELEEVKGLSSELINYYVNFVGKELQ